MENTTAAGLGNNEIIKITTPLVLDTKPRALGVLGELSTTEL